MLEIERTDTLPEGMDHKCFLYRTLVLQVILCGPYSLLYGIVAPVPYYAMAVQRLCTITGSEERI